MTFTDDSSMLILMPSFYQGVLTYGKIGEWRFDKRSFPGGAPPKNLPLPPPGVPETVVSSPAICNF